MTIVNNESELLSAITNEDLVIELNAKSIQIDSIPTHRCVIVMKVDTGLVGEIVNSCHAGIAHMFFGGATIEDLG